MQTLIEQLPPILTALFGGVSIVLWYKTIQQGRRSEKMREWARNITLLCYEYIDVVILGPSDSGKTSIATRWSAPWTNVHLISPSPYWTVSEFSLHEFEPVKRHDEVFDVQHLYEPVLRMRVRDYPGEESKRIEAITHIGSLEKRVVLLLVMDVCFSNGKCVDAIRNARYYSKVFFEQIVATLENVSRSIDTVVVVFNKSDLAPDVMDENATLLTLKSANKDTVDRVESLFGGRTQYIVCSAFTNHNIVNLLGRVALTAIGSDEDGKRLQTALDAYKGRDKDVKR
jgi:GTPase SAR1 family protein